MWLEKAQHGCIELRYFFFHLGAYLFFTDLVFLIVNILYEIGNLLIARLVKKTSPLSPRGTDWVKLLPTM